ncbi:MAG: hypothetical protein JJ975_02285 [Bacteroidia bacterium]|nr:hypothetical protein [Bacteroidia bacterium]
MNFLSHYYFDQQKGNGYFNLGLIFPDIVRNFVRGTKLNLNIDISNESNELQLLRGCIQHVQSDKIFHSWQGFHDMMHQVTQQIRASEHDIDKDWFISHILVELALDHHLIKANPQLAKNLYTDFETVEIEVLHSFLARNDFSNFDQFTLGFDRFMKHRYLESYVESDNIVFALGKICNKMGLTPFSDGQKSLLKQLVEELCDEMAPWVLKLDEELK